MWDLACWKSKIQLLFNIYLQIVGNMRDLVNVGPSTLEVWGIKWLATNHSISTHGWHLWLGFTDTSKVLYVCINLLMYRCINLYICVLLYLLYQACLIFVENFVPCTLVIHILSLWYTSFINYFQLLVVTSCSIQYWLNCLLIVYYGILNDMGAIHPWLFNFSSFWHTTWELRF